MPLNVRAFAMRQLHSQRFGVPCDMRLVADITHRPELLLHACRLGLLEPTQACNVVLPSLAVELTSWLVSNLFSATAPSGLVTRSPAYDQAFDFYCARLFLQHSHVGQKLERKDTSSSHSQGDRREVMLASN